ncbi:hypothetical protein [Azospirillum sp. TSO22-1]|uniref:hypothetical protein n=1 Tax=Azospirillum sp. TSO22-1 TaxID=716789 RepID=UPI0011B54A55|nr:hypothetical protein [Azospirillum sp. TSO22-1]
MDSVAATASLRGRIEVLVYIDSDDPEVEGYRRTFAELASSGHGLGRVQAIIGPPRSVSISWNDLAAASRADVLMMANDDQVYVEAGWDCRLDACVAAYPDRIFCMWFNDGICGEEHCAFPIVSRRWCNKLGYFTPGIFEFIANDTWIMDLGRRVGRLHYIGDVLVEHRHFSVGKSMFDETYRRHREGEQEQRRARDMFVFERTAAIRERDARWLSALLGSIETGEGGVVA